MTHRELAERIEVLDKQAPDGPIRYDEEGFFLDAHNDAVCMFHSSVEHERAIALVSLRNLAPDIVAALRSQADEIDRLQGESRHREMEGLLALLPERKALRDEIDALKAEAIVQGSHKLDEAVKVAKRREAIKAAWVRITGSRGWLSGVDYHEGRCARALLFKPNPLIFCTCGADDFRKLMEE